MDSRLGLNYKSFIKFSIPSMLATLFEPLAGMVDTGLVGNLNTTMLAAMTLGAMLLSSLTWVFNFLVHASTQNISEAVGKKDFDVVSNKIKVSLLVALGTGLVSASLMIFLKDYLYQLIGVESETYEFVNSYFLVRMLGHPFNLLFQTLLSIIQGYSKVVLSFSLVATATVMNILISYLALYHFDLGLKGVAFGTVCAQGLGFVMTLFVVLRLPGVNRKILYCKNFGRAEILHFSKHSINIFLRSLFLTSAFFISTRVSSKISIHAISSHQILLQFWLLLSFITDGMAVSANILAARYLGEKDISAIRTLHRNGFTLSLTVGFFFSTVYFFAEENLYHLYTNDLDLFSNLRLVWPLIVLAQPINALSFIYDGLMFGTSNFAYLRKHMMIGVIFFFLPLAYYGSMTENLLHIWLGLFAVNCYRFLSNLFGLKRFLKNGI